MGSRDQAWNLTALAAHRVTGLCMPDQGECEHEKQLSYPPTKTFQPAVTLPTGVSCSPSPLGLRIRNQDLTRLRQLQPRHRDLQHAMVEAAARSLRVAVYGNKRWVQKEMLAKAAASAWPKGPRPSGLQPAKPWHSNSNGHVKQGQQAIIINNKQGPTGLPTLYT